jgi:hypothetical protein
LGINTPRVAWGDPPLSFWRGELYTHDHLVEDEQLFLRILKQYGGNVTASLIVRGILDGYDWVKIVDERHAEIKELSY